MFSLCNCFSYLPIILPSPLTVCFNLSHPHIIVNPASYFWNKDFTSADREKGGLDEGSGVGGVLARLLGKNSRLKKTYKLGEQATTTVTESMLW